MNWFALVLRFIGSVLRTSRGCSRLRVLLSAGTSEGKSTGKENKSINTGRLDRVNNIVGGLHDVFSGLADAVDCVGGIGAITSLVRHVYGVFAASVRRWATLAFRWIYHREQILGQQQTSSLPISFTAVDHTIISTVEEAQIAAAQWNEKELIDVSDDITPELAIEIWQIFLEHAAGDVIDKAPSLSVKVGQQIILREKIKAASMKLQSKKAAIEGKKEKNYEKEFSFAMCLGGHIPYDAMYCYYLEFGGLHMKRERAFNQSAQPSSAAWSVSRDPHPRWTCKCNPSRVSFSVSNKNPCALHQARLQNLIQYFHCPMTQIGQRKKNRNRQICTKGMDAAGRRIVRALIRANDAMEPVTDTIASAAALAGLVYGAMEVVRDIRVVVGGMLRVARGGGDGGQAEAAPAVDLAVAGACGLGTSTSSTGMENELTCRRTTSDHCHQKLNHGKGRNVRFDDLPEDVICSIFSKLQLKDLVSTSVLSSKWKHMWTICPILRFDSSTLCGSNMCSAEQFTQKFIDNVNAFSGFPNLKKLDLLLLRTTREDLEDMIANCPNLEWLSLNRCHIYDELKFDRPFTRLIYLQVIHCQIKKIEIDAVNLKALVYKGFELRVDFSEAKGLETVDIEFFGIALQYLLTAIPSALPSVQNLTIEARILQESPWFVETSCKFSQLKCLRMLLHHRFSDNRNTLGLASFLKAAPLIEQLELDFNDDGYISDVETEALRSLPKCSYDHLKNVSIIGYVGCIGHVELLVHIVESAPALEALMIDRTQRRGRPLHEYSARLAGIAARGYLDGKILPTTKLDLYETQAAMLARLRAASDAAHELDVCVRHNDDDDDDYVVLHSCDRRRQHGHGRSCLHGCSGVRAAGGLVRIASGARHVRSAVGRYLAAADDDEEHDELSVGDKVLIAADVVVGAYDVVVGGIDVVVGVYDLAEYARGALARLRRMCPGVGIPVRFRIGKKKEDCRPKRIRKPGTKEVRFEDLSEDMQNMIFSKLPLKETVRTSVLSSKWRHLWKISPKLRFDGSTMRGEYMLEKLVGNVNAALKQQRGRMAEALEVKLEFQSRLVAFTGEKSILVDHLNNWVGSAASSCTTSLALDLAPKEFMDRHDRYMFPFELLDGKAASCLQQIQLSFVSLKPPTQFSGFPKLRKLSLHLVQVTGKDLQGLLSSCSNLEWLSIVRCNLNDDELKVDCALSRLLHLRIANCEISKIEMHAPKLKTFIYEGAQLPVDPIQAQELEVADIVFKGDITFQYALTVLPVVLPSVQNLTVHANFGLQFPWLLSTKSKFSQLKYLKWLLPQCSGDMDNIVYLASFLKAAPLLEVLEIHFNVPGYEDAGIPVLRSLPKCPYKNLKSIYITGFRGLKGQAEFLVHAVENASALEVLTIDTATKIGVRSAQHIGSTGGYVARSCLASIVSPKTKFQIVDTGR
uniref:F-box domain-containing protein n=1 Tax=Oryza meridionalis TaxID=40149 RepID=A0A0E0DYH0_9ORYZ